MGTYVNCLKCGEHHSTAQIEFLNIEEDIQGRDIMSFTCPVENESTKSLVFGRPDLCYSEEM